MPGRWVMLPQTEVNIMAPFLLIYEFVFERLGLDRAVMDVVESNRKVRRFHAAYGAEPIDAPLRYADEEQSGLLPVPHHRPSGTIPPPRPHFINCGLNERGRAISQQSSRPRGKRSSCIVVISRLPTVYKVWVGLGVVRLLD